MKQYPWLFWSYIVLCLYTSTIYALTGSWQLRETTQATYTRVYSQEMEYSDLYHFFTRTPCKHQPAQELSQQLFQSLGQGQYASLSIEANLLPLASLHSGACLICPVWFRDQKDGRQYPYIWVIHPDGKLENLQGRETAESLLSRATSGNTSFVFYVMYSEFGIQLIKISDPRQLSSFIASLWLQALQQAAHRGLDPECKFSFASFSSLTADYSPEPQQQLRQWDLHTSSEVTQIDLAAFQQAVARESQKPVIQTRRRNVFTTFNKVPETKLVHYNPVPQLTFARIAATLPKVWNLTNPEEIEYRSGLMANSKKHFALSQQEFVTLPAAGFTPLTQQDKDQFSADSQLPPAPDYLQCCQCGVGIEQWEVTDTAWEEHQIQTEDSPCPYAFMGKYLIQRRHDQQPYFCIATPPDESGHSGLGWYSQGEPVASGSFAEVFIVSSDKDDTFALKIFTGGPYCDPVEARQSFSRERENYLKIQSATAGNYPRHLSQLISQGVVCGGIHDSVPILVLDAMQCTLANYFRLDTTSPPSYQSRLEIIKAMVRGLHSAHNAGLALIDLTPSNFMQRRDGVWLWIDFSEALPESDIVTRSTFPEGFHLGTPCKNLLDSGREIQAREIDMVRLAFMVAFTLHEKIQESRDMYSEQSSHFFHPVSDTGTSYAAACYVKPYFSYLHADDNITDSQLKQVLEICAKCMKNPENFTLPSFCKQIGTALNLAEPLLETSPPTQAASTTTRNEVFESEYCIICFDEDSSFVQASPCGHKNTCKRCLLRWLYTRSDCPTCRQEIREILTH